MSGARWWTSRGLAGHGVGTVALRVRLDVETRLLICRAVGPNGEGASCADARRLAPIASRSRRLGLDVDTLTTDVVLGDDRPAAHLCDPSDALADRARSAACNTAERRAELTVICRQFPGPDLSAVPRARRSHVRLTYGARTRIARRAQADARGGEQRTLPRAHLRGL
jgi:hypothetical protein